jgi:oligopeptide/dipeptide ABC transporter ATP-binding protein
MTTPVVELQDVSKTFSTRHGTAKALQDLSLVIGESETLGLIGESGSGKSTLGRVALGLERPDSGRVRFNGEDIYSAARKNAWRRHVSVVLQEPEQALDPRMTVGASIAEPLRVHEPGWSRAQREERVVEALAQAHLASNLKDRYPRELSGGEQQRSSIARAIITRPKFIVLDEPTASLDLSVRARILSTLDELQQSLGISYLLISHDMETIRRLAHRTVVLYGGCAVETGPTQSVAEQPQHPYTRALLAAVLPIDTDAAKDNYRLRPALMSVSRDRRDGCVLRGRCPEEIPACSGADVVLHSRLDHEVACIRVQDDGESSTRSGDGPDVDGLQEASIEP